jgi:hypothetical protein
MRHNGSLGKLYDRLTPEERFRLDVLAMARGDEEESELLVTTCPRFNYTMNDVGFGGRWQAAKEMATITFMDLSAKVDKLHLLEAFGIILSAHADLADLELGGRGERMSDSSEEDRLLRLAREMPERTEAIERAAAEGALSVWAAFKGFCAEEMGLEAQTLLEALSDPMVETVRELEEIAERLQVEPDLALVEECATTLREAWRRQLEKGR